MTPLRTLCEAESREHRFSDSNSGSLLPCVCSCWGTGLTEQKTAHQHKAMSPVLDSAGVGVGGFLEEVTVTAQWHQHRLSFPACDGCLYGGRVQNWV